MDAKTPQRHGPYRKLAYVVQGKQTCRFVRADCVKEIARRTARFKTFRTLVAQWVECSVEIGKIQFFAPPKSTRPSIQS